MEAWKEVGSLPDLKKILCPPSKPAKSMPGAFRLPGKDAKAAKMSAPAKSVTPTPPESAAAGAPAGKRVKE